MDKINEVADKIMAYLDKGEWSKADRLQEVLKELVKIEEAAIMSKSTKEPKS